MRKRVAPHLAAHHALGIAAGFRPLELQRRIVNSALGSGTIARVAWLCALYAALVLGAGAIKLGFNVYRGWISEGAVRALRRHPDLEIIL